jgi:hypothetical protein
MREREREKEREGENREGESVYATERERGGARECGVCV